MADPFTVESILVLQLDEPAEGIFEAQVFVSGSDFVVGAAGVTARLGAQDVQQSIVNPDGDGFSGFVETMPSSGDKLFVGYDGFEQVDTGLTFQDALGPIA